MTIGPRFTDTRRYVFGVGIGYMTDPTSGDVLYWSDKFQEANTSFAASDNTLNAGMGNGPQMIIATDPNVTVNVTAAEYSAYVKAASVGQAVTAGAPVLSCQSVVAAGTALAVDIGKGTPVTGLGMRRPVCYVQEIGAASPVAKGGIAYAIDPTSGDVAGFAAEAGKRYLVSYYTARPNAQKTTVSTNLKGKIVRFVFARPVYTNYDPTTNSGDLYGWLYEIVPRLQLMADGASNSGGQTSYTTTGITGRGLTWDATEIQAKSGKCKSVGNPVLYRIIVPLDPNCGVDGVIGAVTGQINLQVTESYQLMPSVIFRSGMERGADPASFEYETSDWNVASVNEEGQIVAIGAGTAMITVLYTGPDGHKQYTDVVLVTVFGDKPAYTTLLLSLHSSELSQKLAYSQSAPNAVSVDWGDGSPMESSADISVELAHEYAEPGVYPVGLRTAEGETLTLGLTGGTNYNVLGVNTFKGGTSPQLAAVWMDESTYMSTYAFEDCTALTSVVIPNNITSVNDEFSGCYSLRSMTLGAGVSSFNYFNFTFQTNLSEFHVSADSPYFSAEDGILYNKDKTQIVAFPMAKTGEFTVPDGVTEVAEYAFNQTALSKIDFNEVTAIGYRACWEGKIREIVLPDGPCDLSAGNVFQLCENLESVEIRAGYTLGANTFYSCRGLKTVTMAEGIGNVPASCFRNCEDLAEIVMPSTLTMLGSSAFQDCSSLEAISLPAGVTDIPQSTFSGCSRLKSVIMPGVTSIGSSAFAQCAALEMDGISPIVTKIGNSAFSGCTSLALSEIGSNVTEVGSGAFRGCTSLVGLTVNAQRVDYYAFQECTRLQKVWLRSGVTSITELAVQHTSGGTVLYTDYFSAFNKCSADLILYVERNSRPSGWSSYFNSYASTEGVSKNLTVVYGQTTSPF